MKHSLKITFLLLTMFFVTQMIGIAVVNSYSPHITQVTNETGQVVNVTSYNLPYGTEPPQGITPKTSIISIIIALVIAIVVMFILMSIRAELFLRLWFFFVITLSLAITINAALLGVKNSAIIAVIFALPLAFAKVFRRNIIVHNLTELAIYPGIAAIFVPLLSLWTISLLFVLISLYDMYAVWHSGFMQKMAKYQIQKLKVFSGFFVPYLGQKERNMLAKAAKTSKGKTISKKIKVNVAILGGGDVVFPIMLAGVVLGQFGFVSALIISIGATLALAGLFYISKKGKFYPAMPFISLGCFAALALVYIINLLI